MQHLPGAIAEHDIERKLHAEGVDLPGGLNTIAVPVGMIDWPISPRARSRTERAQRTSDATTIPDDATQIFT